MGWQTIVGDWVGGAYFSLNAPLTVETKVMLQDGITTNVPWEVMPLLQRSPAVFVSSQIWYCVLSLSADVFVGCERAFL